jgi:hypothetical protein
MAHRWRGFCLPASAALAHLPASLTDADLEEEAVERWNVETGYRDPTESIVAEADAGVSLVGHDPGVLAEAEIDDGGTSRPDRASNPLGGTKRSSDIGDEMGHGIGSGAVRGEESRVSTRSIALRSISHAVYLSLENSESMAWCISMPMNDFHSTDAAWAVTTVPSRAEGISHKGGRSCHMRRGETMPRGRVSESRRRPEPGLLVASALSLVL